jgi:hypothetical protein
MTNPGLEKREVNMSSSFARVHVIKGQKMYSVIHLKLRTRQNWAVGRFTCTDTTILCSHRNSNYASYNLQSGHYPIK